MRRPSHGTRDPDQRVERKGETDARESDSHPPRISERPESREVLLLSRDEQERKYQQTPG